MNFPIKLWLFPTKNFLFTLSQCHSEWNGTEKLFLPSFLELVVKHSAVDRLIEQHSQSHSVAFSSFSNSLRFSLTSGNFEFSLSRMLSDNTTFPLSTKLVVKISTHNIFLSSNADSNTHLRDEENRAGVSSSSNAKLQLNESSMNHTKWRLNPVDCVILRRS